MLSPLSSMISGPFLALPRSFERSLYSFASCSLTTCAVLAAFFLAAAALRCASSPSLARWKTFMTRACGKSAVASPQSSDRLLSSVFCIVKSSAVVAEPAEPVFEYSWKMSFKSL